MAVAKKVTLPSGAELEITMPPFIVSKALYEAVMEEAKTLKFDPKADIDVNLFKDLFCVGMTSKKIAEALGPCLERARYNKLRIDKDTFEPVEARGDYMHVCFEVGKESVLPFLKSLSAKFSPLLEKLKKDPA